MRRVILTNQFTTAQQTWTIGQPRWLLAPTGKEFDTQPALQRGDHFVCYEVMKAASFRTSATLRDQFDTRRKKAERIDDLTPAYFCIPVTKRRKVRQEEPLLNPETHLAVYTIKRDAWPDAPPFKTIDQFGQKDLTPLHSQWLGVPSQKHAKPTEVPDWP